MQQVDLYVEALRPDNRQPTLGQVTLIWLFVVLCCLAYSGYLAVAVERKQAQLVQGESLKASVTKSINVLEDKLSNSAPDQAMIEENEQLVSVLKKGSELMAITYVEDGVLGSQSMVKVLEGFARQSVEGVWLDQIMIQRGPEMVIEGYSRTPDLIPVYLQGLGREAVFSGMRFEGLTLSAKTGREPLAFRVASRGETEFEEEMAWTLD